MDVSNVSKVFGLSVFAFMAGILVTPILTRFLYKHRLWRKVVRTTAFDGSKTPIFAELHKDREMGVPRFGGVLIWAITLALAYFLWAVARVWDGGFLQKLNFVSRNQTWLPLFTLAAASLLGLADDIMQVYERGKNFAGGMRFSRRLFLVSIIALAGAWWFYFKLEFHTVFIPGYGNFEIGAWIIPLFILTMIVLFSSSVIDGIDGLSGGVFASIFAAYAGIAFFRGQYDIAALAGVILGALLAFLWFNIPPARFYMGESGILGLTTTLTVIAFLTDSVFALPIIAFVPLVEVVTNIIQILSKRFRGKKVFLVAPIHHHFEAKGWPPYKVTMRFWVISTVMAIIGMVIALLGR